MDSKRLKLSIDIIMATLMPLQMVYLILGEVFHEINGIILFLLFVIHNILNRKWYRTIFRGNLSFRKLVRVVTNLSLVVLVLILTVTGIALSTVLFANFSFNIDYQLMRTLHFLCSYWCFILMSVHAGFHIKLPKKQYIKALIYLIALYGLYNTITHDLFSYLTLRQGYATIDFERHTLLHITDYLSIFITWVLLGRLLINKRHKSENIN